MDEEIDEYNTEVPVILIQPYIENEIGHGLLNLGEEHKEILQLQILKNEQYSRARK